MAANNIMRFLCPARSSNFAANEQVRDILGRAIHNIPEQSQTLVALENTTAQWIPVSQLT